MARRTRLPPFIDMIPVLIGKAVESVVDALANLAYGLIRDVPIFRDLDESERRAIAYAIVGDIIASPLPEPLDTPIDVVVQERLRNLLPEVDRHRRVFTRIAESIPYIELLPNYTISVLAAIRERDITAVTETAKRYRTE